MMLILAAIGALWVVSLVAVFIGVVVAIIYHDSEIGEMPEPDICPGCDSYLELDDDGYNICPTCGMTWQHPSLGGPHS